MTNGPVTPRRITHLVVAATFALVPVAPLRAHDAWLVPPGSAVTPVEAEPLARQDSASVVAAVERFHAALAAGDSAAVADLLAPGAVILESGGIETREQYLGGHLRGDIAFAQAVPRQKGPVGVRVAGDVAWAASTSLAQGTYREREINSTTAELMVLVRREGRWQIAAVHWSSRARR